MAKVLNTTHLSETLHLSECNDGFWLYDDTRGMNLAMRSKTKETALLDALNYYQKRLTEVEARYKNLRTTVGGFLNQLEATNDDEFCLKHEEIY